MTTRLPFTEQALRRAISAVRKEGLSVTGTTIRPDGTIIVHHVPPAVAGIVPGAQHAPSSEFEDFEA